MRYIKLFQITGLALLWISTSGSPAHASGAEQYEYQQKLQKIRSEISNYNTLIDKDKGKRSQLYLELRKIDRRISNNAQALKKAANDIRAQQKQTQSTKNELSAIELQIEQQKKQLTKQLQSAYLLGKSSPVKLLMNQQDPNSVGRAFSYYQYLNRAREKKILDFQHLIENRIKVQTRLTDEQIALNNLVVRLKAQSSDLKSLRFDRKKLILQLDNSIDDSQRAVSSLQTNRERIEDILRSLSALLSDIPDQLEATTPFKKRKGKLSLPVKGEIITRFGGQLKSSLVSKGILIQADYGKPVKVVAHGRIAFADWLQSYGFTIIVDHGDGYITLYAHNEVLLKEVGEWVETGEQIATVGDSGNQRSSGLYFEIRYNGEATNPIRWTKR